MRPARHRTAGGLPRPVIIESPYAGNVDLHMRYLRACIRDSLMRGEAPFASHAIYTQPGVLDDLIPHERLFGIHAGFAWRRFASCTALYVDLGLSQGMLIGRNDAYAQRLDEQANPAILMPHEVVERRLGGEWAEVSR